MTRSIFEMPPANTKLCPSCFTNINVAATRCPNCTSSMYPDENDIQYPVYEISEEQRKKEMAENSRYVEESMRRDRNYDTIFGIIFYGPIVLLIVAFLLFVITH